MKLPTVSVLIPAHNEERYIGRCIRSILNQSMPREDYEIIAINDASSDRTRYALELFGDEIKIVHNENKMGLPASLNLGLRAARGQFVVRLDGDDYVNADYLHILSTFLRLNPYMDAVACDYFLVDDNENVIGRKDSMESPLGCGIMFRMDQLFSIGLYDDKFLVHEDKDLRIRFLKKFKIHRVELPLYRYRRHLENMTNNSERLEFFERALVDKHGVDFVWK